MTLERAIDDLVRQVDEIRLELLRFKRLVRENREAEADKTPARAAVAERVPGVPGIG